MHFFWNSLPTGSLSQTSLRIFQRFHRHLKLNLAGIEILSTVADPGATGRHSPLKQWTLFSHVVYQSLIDNTMNGPNQKSLNR